MKFFELKRVQALINPKYIVTVSKQGSWWVVVLSNGIRYTLNEEENNQLVAFLDSLGHKGEEKEAKKEE